MYMYICIYIQPTANDGSKINGKPKNHYGGAEEVLNVNYPSNTHGITIDTWYHRGGLSTQSAPKELLQTKLVRLCGPQHKIEIML